jgi:hypothetical protein
MMLGMVVARDLSDAERRVWNAFPAGSRMEFGTGRAEDDDPAAGEGWGLDRQVRAEVLAALLCGAVEVEPGQIGEIHLCRAHVIGELSLASATLKHRLRLRGCYIADGIDLSDATTPTLDLRGCNVGSIGLSGAKIDGALFLSGAHLDGKGGPALIANGLTVTANMVCDGGFQADGGMSLIAANIGSQFNLRGAHLNSRSGPALTGARLTVILDMFCDGEFQADGEVNLIGASIGGQLSLNGAHLNGKDGTAINASGATVTAGIFCDRGFQADGEVNLIGASIGGQVTFRGAHLDGKGGPSLAADRLTVVGGMFCDGGFQADGEVNLAGASIGGQLALRGAHLDGKDRNALTAQRLTVTADMVCDGGFQADGGIDLVNAKIGSLVDERECWPQRLRLDGLAYSDLTYLPARERLDWLNRSGSYSPQPYEQLAGYYRRLGHDDQARCVLLAKQRHRRRQRPWRARWWGWLQDALAGYGYAPGRALLLLVAAFVVGWLAFSTRHPVPVGPGPHPVFNAALYALDVLIPAPALGQASDFDPQGIRLAVAAGLHIFGWLLAITMIAAITRAFTKE